MTLPGADRGPRLMPLAEGVSQHAFAKVVARPEQAPAAESVIPMMRYMGSR